MCRDISNNINKMKPILWIGKEKEGNYKNVWTLFIGSPDIRKGEIMKELISHPNINQLYFGAGCCTDINLNVVKECIEIFDDMIITLEIDITKLHTYDIKILQEVNLIITVNHKNFHGIIKFKKENIQIKLQSLEDKNIMFLNGCCIEDVNTSTLGKRMYKGDIVIKNG